MAYQEILQKLGKRRELVAAWRHRAERNGASEQEKEAIAYRALEAGEKELAESIFFSLARRAAPDSRHVLELLYLWGPRPEREALDWMVARAKSASEEEGSIWLQHLINAGAPQLAIDVARDRLPPPGSESPLVGVYVDALVVMKDRDELEKVLRLEMDAQANIDKMRRFARIAMESNLTAVAKNGFEKILSDLKEDPESLRWLGALAFFASNYTEAKSYLTRYLSSNSGDWDSHFYFGEILRREKAAERAELHYLRALQMIDRRPSKDFNTRVLHAKLLLRTGRKVESITEFEDLMRERPKDFNIRADFVDMLLDQGMVPEAQKVLEATSVLNSMAGTETGQGGMDGVESHP
jgi:tetratricopeptide (TPR) repeat protein